MSNDKPMTSVVEPGKQAPCEAAVEYEWISALRAGRVGHDDAVRRLREIVARAARHQLTRMPQVWTELGGVRAEEIIESAANEATVAVLARLDAFEGRSKFTTWVYKFGIRYAAAEARRALWRDRPVDLDGQPEPPSDQAMTRSDQAMTPEVYVEAKDFSAAVSVALETALTPHQRRIALALLVDQVPIDVLAERLGTNRNALYKTLHDARVRLRTELRDRGYLRAPRRGCGEDEAKRRR